MNEFSSAARAASCDLARSMFSGVAVLVLAWCMQPLGSLAQDRPAPLDVMSFSVTVSSELPPDVAVVTFAAVREGNDVATLTQDVNQVIAHNLVQVHATPGMTVSTGGLTTNQRFANAGFSSGVTHNGWQVRSELIVRSKDIVGLGRLAGNLAAAGPNALQIVSNQFELSPEVRNSEEAALLERGAAAFRAKATSAMKAFGYSAYTVRELTLGSSGANPIHGNGVQAFSAARSEPMPLEGSLITLSLTVNATIQLRH